MKNSYKMEHLTKTNTFNLLKSKFFAVATISLGHITLSRTVLFNRVYGIPKCIREQIWGIQMD